MESTIESIACIRLRVSQLTAPLATSIGLCRATSVGGSNEPPLTFSRGKKQRGKDGRSSDDRKDPESEDHSAILQQHSNNGRAGRAAEVTHENHEGGCRANIIARSCVLNQEERRNQNESRRCAHQN